MPQSNSHLSVLRTILETSYRVAVSRTWVWIAISTAIAFPLMLGFLTVAYESNDDALMSMIVSGTAASVAPDEHLVHSHYWIGLALKGLYSSFSNVAWYGGYLVLVQIVAQVGIAYCVAGVLYTRLRWCVYVLYLAVVQTHLLTHLQFTSTAFLATQAGVLIVTVCLYRKATRPPQSLLLPLLAGTALLILGGLIRQHSCHLAMVLGIPAVVGLILYSRGARRVWVPATLVYTAALLAVTGSWHLNQRYYDSDPHWRGFYEYNALRVKFNDYLWFGYTSDTQHVFESAGWSRSDHAMLADWFYTDIENFQHEKLAQIADRLQQPLIRTGPAGCLRVARTILANKFLQPMLFVAVLAYLLTAQSVWNRRIQLATFLLEVLVILGLTVMVKAPPPHVFMPILSFSLAMAAVLPEKIGPNLPSAFSSVGPRVPVITLKLATAAKTHAAFSLPLSPRGVVVRAVVLMAAFSVPLQIYHQYRRSRGALHWATDFDTIVEDLSAQSDKLVVAWAGAFPFQHMLPLRSPKPYRDLHLLSLGWSQRTPINDDVLRAHGIDELPRELYQRDDIRLISTPRLNDIWFQYARERLGVETQFEVEREAPGYVIGRIRLCRSADAVSPDRRPKVMRTASEGAHRTLK